MKLIYDASVSLLPLTGVGRYTTELLRALIETWPPGNPPPKIWMNSLRQRPSRERHGFLREALHDRRVEVVRTRLPGPLLLTGWEWFGWPPVEMVAGGCDVVHCPAAYVAPARYAARVVTIHDLHALRHPRHGAPLGGGYLAGTLPDRLPEVEAVIVPSSAVCGEVVSHFPRVHPERIHVVPEGVASRWFESPDPKRVADTLRRRGISQPYVLTVGTLEPRKNQGRLFKAMAAWRREAKPDETVPLLVGVGRPGWGGITVERLCRRAALDPRAVCWIADVDDAELSHLYAGASVVVVPSLWEGFGLPALEAMACGKPLVVSNRGGLPEVTGGTAVEVNPYHIRELATAVRELVNAREERKAELGRRAAARARTFTWTAAARKTLQVYREAASQQGR